MIIHSPGPRGKIVTLGPVDPFEGALNPKLTLKPKPLGPDEGATSGEHLWQA